MNLRDLRYLVTVADCRHFGKAANLCYVSQPTLSAQLKKLEEYLGIQLFERNNKHVLITPIGQTIVDKARLILREADQIRELARAASQPYSGRLQLGIIPTLGPYLLPHIVPCIKSHFPKLELMLYEDQTSRILAALHQGSLDAAILALPVNSEGLTVTALFSEPFWVALPAQHPLAKKALLKPEDLQSETLLLLSEGHCLRDQALEVCRLAGIKERVDFSATSLETLRQMVAAGAGITFLPQLAVNMPIANQDAIAIRPFAPPVPYRKIGILWRNTTARIQTLTAITQQLLAAVPVLT